MQAARLLAAIRAEGLPDELLGQDDSEPQQLAELDAAGLRGYARALNRSAGLARGEPPSEWNTPAECAGCGPVWLWEGLPARVDACPWCQHRAAGVRLTRPPVRCGECRYYRADPLNPEAGMGGCGVSGLPAHYPMRSHVCATFAGVEFSDAIKGACHAP